MEDSLNSVILYNFPVSLARHRAHKVVWQPSFSHYPCPAPPSFPPALAPPLSSLVSPLLFCWLVCCVVSVPPVSDITRCSSFSLWLTSLSITPSQVHPCLEGPPNLLMQKGRRVSDELCSGVSYTAVGCDFEVDAPTIYTELGAFRRKHIYNLVMCWISGTNVVSRGSQELNPAFPWGRGVQCSLTLCPRCLYKTWLPQVTHATEIPLFPPLSVEMDTWPWDI